MTENESLIQSLRYCASGAKFQKDCDGCQLEFTNGKTCVECIDNVLTQAADTLEKHAKLEMRVNILEAELHCKENH